MSCARRGGKKWIQACRRVLIWRLDWVPFTMAHHRRVIWVDPEPNAVDGRMATSWATYDILTAVSNGPPAVSPNSTISSSRTRFLEPHKARWRAPPRRFHQLFFIFLGNDSGETATCLFNSPHEDAVLPRVLPGKLLSLDAQCRMDRGTSACFVIIVTRDYIFQLKNFLNFFFLISYETTERRPRLRSALLFRRFIGVLCLLQTGCRGLCLRRRTGNLLISNAYCAWNWNSTVFSSLIRFATMVDASLRMKMQFPTIRKILASIHFWNGPIPF